MQGASEHIPAVPAGSPPLPAALLWHQPGAGPAHFDLLLAVRPPAGDDDACAATWRVAAGAEGEAGAQDAADAATGGVPADFRRGAVRVPAERIHDHRALYLRLDAPRVLDGGRGDVFPVARGTWHPGPGGGAEVTWADGSCGTVRFVRRADGGLDLLHAPAPQPGDHR